MASILRSFGLGKNKHQKLKEDKSESLENIYESIASKPENAKVFNCKYLGSSAIALPSDYHLTRSTITQIIEMAKLRGNKAGDKVALMISSQRIAMSLRGNGKKQSKKSKKTEKADVKTSAASMSSEDSQSHDSGSVSVSSSNDHVEPDKLLNICIYKISYCSGDLDHKRTVGFIATNMDGTHECHAFMATKQKKAQSIAIAISQAFNQAFQDWIQTRKKDPDQDEQIEKMFKANKENLDSIGQLGKAGASRGLALCESLDHNLLDNDRYLESNEKLNILYDFDQPKGIPRLLLFDE